MSDFEELRRTLSSSDDQFRSWADEHHRYEDRLSELAAKATLTPEEEVEEKQLKKRKLFLKDQMAARIREFSTAQTTTA